MRDFYDFLFAEFPVLLDRWHRQQDDPPQM